MQDGLADIGPVFFVQYLVAGGDDAELYLRFNALAEFFAAHGEYDAVVPAIEQAHGQLLLLYQGLA